MIIWIMISNLCFQNLKLHPTQLIKEIYRKIYLYHLYSFDIMQDAVKADPVNASDICLPTLLPILAEYANDSEMCQNLLDLLSVLVNENNFKNHKEILSINVESIFKYKDSIRILFEQLDNDNMYVKLVVIDILRSSLTVNTVRLHALYSLQSLVGECISQSPLALQKLVDCLNDNREEIRNDLLLILLLLVEKFSDIANFIAFQVFADVINLTCRMDQICFFAF